MLLSIAPITASDDMFLVFPLRMDVFIAISGSPNFEQRPLNTIYITNTLLCQLGITSLGCHCGVCAIFAARPE